MGKWIEEKIKKEKDEERRRQRNDKYGEFCFSLAKVIFSVLIVGSVLFMFQKDSDYSMESAFALLSMGLVVFIILIKIGGNFLK